MLSQHNVALVALCYEFSDELQALGFDPSTIKKTAIDIQSSLNKSERVMNIARSTAESRNSALLQPMYPPLFVAPSIDLQQGKWMKQPVVEPNFDQFWPFLQNSP